MNFRKMAAGLVVLMLLTTWAFAAGSSEPRAEAQAADLTFTLWSGNEAHLTLFRSIADAYMAQDPNVRSVTYQTIPHGSYLERITLQASGRNAPDAGWLFERAGTAFMDAGVLLDLRSALNRHDFDDFAPAILSLWQRGDAVYGVPFSTSPMVIFYNADMFSEAGVPTPTELQARGEWTWERFREVARTIRERTGKFAYRGPAFDETPIRVMVPTMAAYGAQVWDDAGNVTVNSPEAIRAIQLYHDMLFRDQSVVPPGNLSDFFAGDVASTATFISFAAQLANVDWEWGIAKLPAGPAGQPGVIGQSSIVAFSRSDNPEVAADFVAFMTNRENMTRLAQFFPPSRNSVLESDTFINGNPHISGALMASVIVPSMQAGQVLPVHEQYANLLLTAQPFLDRLWRPGADVRAVLNELADAWRPIVAN